jgi:hypothetical protein
LNPKEFLQQAVGDLDYRYKLDKTASCTRLLRVRIDDSENGGNGCLDAEYDSAPRLDVPIANSISERFCLLRGSLSVRIIFMIRLERLIGEKNQSFTL